MPVTKGSDNVFIDCGFPPAEAENLRIRSAIMIALTRHIQEKKLTQVRAAAALGVSQPRISALMRGKIGHFTIDTLANMAANAGLRVEVDINPARPKTRTRRVA